MKRFGFLVGVRLKGGGSLGVILLCNILCFTILLYVKYYYVTYYLILCNILCYTTYVLLYPQDPCMPYMVTVDSVAVHLPPREVWPGSTKQPFARAAAA